MGTSIFVKSFNQDNGDLKYNIMLIKDDGDLKYNIMVIKN